MQASFIYNKKTACVPVCISSVQPTRASCIAFSTPYPYWNWSVFDEHEFTLYTDETITSRHPGRRIAVARYRHGSDSDRCHTGGSASVAGHDCQPYCGSA